MCSACVRLWFEANHQKATRSLNYFALRAGGRLRRLKAVKLVFFAHRYHLLKYGCPMVGDEYWAMSLGPVPSMTADIAESDELLDECEREYAASFLRPSPDDPYSFETISAVDESVFSKSDLEALASVWDRLGSLGERELVKLRRTVQFCPQIVLGNTERTRQSVSLSLVL